MVEAIEQAAAEMFAAHGYAHTTTNKIAERAGVSVGSLYQYFPNKDSLLARLWYRHHEEVHQVVEAGLERLADPSVPLEDGIRRLLVELLDLHRRNPALTRALSATVLRESPAVEQQHVDLNDQTEADELAALLAVRPDVRAGDHLAMAAVLGQTTSQLTRWLVHDAPVGVDPEVLLEETVQLLARFLRE
jgi:AcrR family transcriptional regulator